MNYVAYYRVSTARQGQSGLGLEAQEEAVKRLIELKGGQIVKSFTDVESGAKNDRPSLLEALSHARKTNCALVVAKLDRLSRDAKFLLTLADAAVPILFGDFPDLETNTSVGRMVLTQMAAVAEFERRRISERVSAALQASKARGTQLGGFRGGHFPEEVREAGRLHKIELANKKALELHEIINEIDPKGQMSRVQIAAEMNLRNQPTPSGKGNWSVTTVTRILKKVEAIHEQQRNIAAKSVRSISQRLQKQSRTFCKRSLGSGAGSVAG